MLNKSPLGNLGANSYRIQPPDPLKGELIIRITVIFTYSLKYFFKRATFEQIPCQTYY